jgi:hypothetical protein
MLEDGGGDKTEKNHGLIAAILQTVLDS